jgi:hypothetical protein
VGHKRGQKSLVSQVTHKTGHVASVDQNLQVSRPSPASVNCNKKLGDEHLKAVSFKMLGDFTFKFHGLADVSTGNPADFDCLRVVGMSPKNTNTNVDDEQKAIIYILWTD